MPQYEAIVATESGSRYLRQLCKHWSHKFEVTFDAVNGRVHLPAGDVSFVAEPDRLTLTLRGQDGTALPRLCEVVTEHLQRFAFREALVVEWVERGDGAVGLKSSCVVDTPTAIYRPVVAPQRSL